jgi:hypothetical protein
VQPPLPRTADVHAGPLPHGFEAVEDLTGGHIDEGRVGTTGGREDGGKGGKGEDGIGMPWASRMVLFQ